jgi:tetratricopeptide (TPR) repeat protein
MEAEEAARHFELLREHRPDNPEVLAGLARCYRELSRLPEARGVLDRALALPPPSAEALTERGKVALDDDRPAEAEAWLRQALAREPNNSYATYNLAQSLKRQGKSEEAQACLRRFEGFAADRKRVQDVLVQVQKMPHDAGLRCEAGALCLRLGREPEGLLWLVSALREDPRHRPTREALADYFERIGKPEIAQRHRQAAKAP